MTKIKALPSDKITMLVTAKWSIDDYHRIVESGVLAQRQVELLKGEIIEMAPEGEPHAYSSDEAGEYLVYLLGNRAKVRYAKPITLPASNSEPEPDLAVVQRLGREYRQHHPYPHNIFWLIEYAHSSLSKDLVVKSTIYAEAGIPEYWVVDLNAMTLIIMRSPTSEGYKSTSTLADGTISPLAFPDLIVEVNRLINP